MPQICSICTHPDRVAIDKALIVGESLRNIAERCSVSVTALHRHKTHNHIPSFLVKAEHAAEITRADTLLDQVRSLNTRAVSILDQAEHAGDLRTALQGIREVRGCLELLMKIASELNDSPKVSILLSYQWVTLRTSILQALENYPEARLHLADVLSHEVQE